MKVSEYVARRVADHGISQVFMMTGGGSMHLNDSLGFEPRLTCLFNHHEQACAIGAEGYARVTGKPALVNVTTGPGGVNALTGVYGAWTDSIPMLVVSGQVKRETLVTSYALPGLRQLGDQEIDIIAMAKGVTKYAVLVSDPQSIRYHLDKALHLITHGRPGPCWLDIPIDVQAAQIEPDQLPAYDPEEAGAICGERDLPARCRDIVERFAAAERPVVLVGTGVRLAGAEDIFQRVTQKLGVPVAPAWTAIDLVPTDDPLFCGRTGTIGDRAGNFAVQNADLVLVLGSRLNIRQVSYNWRSFAREAFVIQVDVDKWELIKPTVRPDMGIECDARVFLDELDRQLDAAHYDRRAARRLDRVVQGAGGAVPRGRGTSPRRERQPRQPVPLHRAAVRAAGRERHRGLRQRDGERRHLPGGEGGAGDAHLRQLRMRRDGFRPAGRGGCRDRGGRPPRDLPRRRRQHPAERPGAADGRPPPAPDQDLRPEQRGLPVDAHEPGRVLRPVRRRRSAQRVVVSLDGGARRRLRDRVGHRAGRALRGHDRGGARIRTGPSCAK